jgi:EmrB/QacA subfamily drug resistance transporter
MQNSPIGPDGHPRRWQILAIMCSCLILVVAGVSALNIAIPKIIEALEPSSTQTLWIVDSYALVFAGLLLPAGAIGDRFGRKGALIVGLGIFLAGALWSAWAGGPNMLIAARGFMGVGAAFVMPATLSIIVSVFPPGERAKAIAVWAGFAGAGASIGIIGAGLLLEKFWWGSVFFINVPLALLAAGLIAFMVPTSRDEAQTPLDPAGSLLSILGLGALVYAIIEGGDAGWGQTSTIFWFVVAVFMLGAWFTWERRIPNPMLDPRLFRRVPFSMGSLTISSAFAVMFGMFFLLTQYFQFVQGHSPLGAGVRNLPFAATMVVVAPRSPQLAARLGKRGTITIGLILQAVGFMVLALHEPDTAYILTVLGLVPMAAGMAMIMPAASEAIVSSLPPSKAGVASAWNDSTREIGGALGIALLGTLHARGFRSGMSDAVAGLPAETADLASEGIGPAFRLAQAGLPELLEPAKQSFVDGMSVAFTVSAISTVVVAAIIAMRYPRRADEPAQAVDEVDAVT